MSASTLVMPVFLPTIKKKTCFGRLLDDTILDLTAITTEVIAESTKKEYREASERIKSDGVVPFVDELLLILELA